MTLWCTYVYSGRNKCREKNSAPKPAWVDRHLWDYMGVVPGCGRVLGISYVVPDKEMVPYIYETEKKRKRLVWIEPWIRLWIRFRIGATKSRNVEGRGKETLLIAPLLFSVAQGGRLQRHHRKSHAFDIDFFLAVSGVREIIHPPHPWLVGSSASVFPDGSDGTMWRPMSPCKHWDLNRWRQKNNVLWRWIGWELTVRLRSFNPRWPKRRLFQKSALLRTTLLKPSPENIIFAGTRRYQQNIFY